MLPRISSFGSDMEYMPMTREKAPTTSPLRCIICRLVPPALLLFVGILIGVNYPSFLSIYTRRPAELPSYLPQKLPPPPHTLSPPLQSLPPPQDPIPNIVHYVYGLDTTPQPDFPYFAYLAMRSAMMVLKPDRVMFHCVREPQGYWWDRVLGWEGWIDEHGIRRGMVEIKRAREVDYIGASQRPVHHADIIRLEVLHLYGGVYLDIDTFIIRPFAPLSLYSYDTVMAMEARILNFLRGPQSDDEMDPKGLCNAIIISRPKSAFLERWLETYDAFDEKKWTEHSVEMPWTLAKLYPTTVTVLSDRAFFWPLWSDDHIQAVYASTYYDFERSGQLAYHAWESVAKKYLEALDPSTINTIETSFTRMARKFREPDEEKKWKAAGKLDGVGSGAAVDKGTEEGEREEIIGSHDRPDIRMYSRSIGNVVIKREDS